MLAAHEYIQNHHTLDRDAREHLERHAPHDWEIVDNTARLCVMNLYLHNIGDKEGESPIRVADSLLNHPGTRFDMMLTNPPFGKKSIVTEEGELSRETQTIVRDDVWTTTSNKQLNFGQHVWNLLKINGGAAVEMPDNVLLEGDAGEPIRRSGTLCAPP